MLLTAITSLEPPAASHVAPVSTNVSATFDVDINPSSATASSLVVHGTQSGLRLAGNAAVTATGPLVTLDPTRDFFPGELIKVTATSSIQSTGGQGADRHVWSFRAGVPTGSASFADSGQTGLGATYKNRLGDLDADGDLDAYVLNGDGSSSILMNDGGVFTNSQNIGNFNSYDVRLGDLDGDGDLDAFLISERYSANRVMLNDGTGQFSVGQTLADHATLSVDLGDLDGDGDLDAYIGTRDTNRVLFNSGNGTFNDSGQAIGRSPSRKVKIGDVDQDGDLDLLSGNPDNPDRIYLNDGSGTFTDSNQQLGAYNSRAVDFGDIDGDGDPDLVMAHTSGANFVLLNEAGVFTDSGQRLGDHDTWGLALGDLDGDGDLDMLAGNTGEENRVWLNDGTGVFSEGEAQGAGTTRSIEFGDLDGDGDLDAFIGNLNGSEIWFNQNLTPSVTLAIDNSSLAEAGGTATVTATLSAVHTDPVTVELATSGEATLSDDYRLSAQEIVVAAGETSAAITLTAVQDTVDEPDESIVIDISGVTNGDESGTQQVTATIVDDDEPPVPDVTINVDNASIAEAGGVAIFAVALSEATTLPVTVQLEFAGTAAATDYAATATEITVPAGATSGSVSVTAVDDAVNEADETVVVRVTSVTNGNELGDQEATTTIVDDDAPPTLTVTSLTPTASGFTAEFSTDLGPDGLTLYDTQNAGMGPADLLVEGAASGPVAGSMMVDSNLRMIHFIKSGGPLDADTYTVRMRSAADAFVDSVGELLDGDGDGVTGDDFVGTFPVDETPEGTVIVSIPDFVRGAGQPINLPADTDTGIPVTISEGANVRAVDLRVAYDPSLLRITGATVADGVPAGATVITNTTTPGLAILVFFSSTALSPGEQTFINLQAEVPAEASASYGDQQLLDLHGVTVSDGNDNESPVRVDDAFHLASYFGDVSGNGRVNASDAAQVARFAALIDRGFAGSLNADPIIVGDPSGNGRINAADASLVAQFAALIPVPQIPPIPTGIAAASWAVFAQPPGSASTKVPRTNPPETDDAVIATEESWSATVWYLSKVDSVMQEWRAAGEESAGATSLEDAIESLWQTQRLASA